MKKRGTATRSKSISVLPQAIAFTRHYGFGVPRFFDYAKDRRLQIHAGSSEVEYRDMRIEINPKEDRLITLKPAKPGTP